MKKQKLVSLFLTLVLAFALTAITGMCAFAEEETKTEAEAQKTEAQEAEDNTRSAKAMAAAIAVGLVGAAGAIGMAIAIGKSTESMARQPEMAGKINSAMMLGLVFIETAIIYALIVAILVIFVL